MKCHSELNYGGLTTTPCNLQMEMTGYVISFSTHQGWALPSIHLHGLSNLLLNDSKATDVMSQTLERLLYCTGTMVSVLNAAMCCASPENSLGKFSGGGRGKKWNNYKQSLPAPLCFFPINRKLLLNSGPEVVKLHQSQSVFCQQWCWC